jgi:hypothetical protein
MKWQVHAKRNGAVRGKVLSVNTDGVTAEAALTS